MAYSKDHQEIHSRIAALYEKYGNKGFISFKKAPEIKGTQFLETIIAAIENKQVLRMTYLPFYEDKPYFNNIHPYFLKEFGFRWYLVGLNAFKGQIRTYALDRIRDLELQPETGYQEAHVTAEAYFKNAVGIIAPQEEPPFIKLAVQLTQAQYLITQPWHDSQNIEEENEQEVIFSFRVHPTYEFRSLIWSLGKDGRVLEPRSLKEEIKKELEDMLAAY